MKKLLFMLCMFMVCTNVFSENINGFELTKTDTKARVGLFLAFSGVDSKYEDDNVVVEIYNQELWVINKTNRTIYLDLAQCFVYYNDASFCLYEPDEKDEDHITETQLINIAPKDSKAIAGLGGYIAGLYSSNNKGLKKKARKKYNVHYLTEDKINFMNIIDEMRMELEGTRTNSTVRHLTENESFIRLKAAIAYSFNKESKDGVEDVVPVVISSWVSDIILSKYYTLLPPPQEKVKSLAAKKINPALVCVPADTPFEYDEEKSPIIGHDITIDLNKGQFVLDNLVVDQELGHYAGEKTVGRSYGKDGSGSYIYKIGKTIYNKLSIEWLGTNIDFSKIKDNKKGIATFGDMKVENIY